jgi:peptidoglycan-associated lipoprotein
MSEHFRSHPGIRAPIEGHCDERGTAPYSMALGERRAAAAREYLVSLGPPATTRRTGLKTGEVISS